MLELRSVSYRYVGTSRLAVDGCSLQVKKGERVVLVGRNGSGKSTLLSLCKGGVRPSSGEVLLDGRAPSSEDPLLLRRCVGILRQDPRSQLVSSLVEEELAFGPQNLGIGGEGLARRVAEALRLCGIEDLAQRRTMELSGGQMQRVALAAALTLEPSYLALDEPCAQLDPLARRNLRWSLAELARRGTGLVMSSHLVEDVAAADRVLLLEGGSIAWEGRPLELFASSELLARAGLVGSSPDALHVLAQLGVEPRSAVEADARNLRELVARLRPGDGVRVRPLGGQAFGGPPATGCGAEGHVAFRGIAAGTRPPLSSGTGLEFEDVGVSYEAGTVALDRVSLRARAGRLTLLAGESGSGKTTAALVAAGLLEADVGSVTLCGEKVAPADVGLAFQRPEDQLFCATALEDASLGPRNLGASELEARTAAAEALRRLGVGEEAWGLSPLAGSGGERRRIALAGILAMRRRAYVFDEPTAGLDGVARELLVGLVRGLADEGAAVVVVSHDLDEWLPLADDACLLRAGRVSWQGTAANLGCRPDVLATSGLGLPLYLRLGEALYA